MSDALIGLAGVVVGVLAALGKEAVSYWTGRRNAGRYAAVRIVCVLDEYVEKCVDVVHDDGTREGRPAGRTDGGEEYLSAQVDSPEPPEFADDIDWTSISPDLMYRVLALPNLAVRTERFISAASEHASPPDYDEFFRARWEGYADLGLEALGIANELRRQFKLPLTSLEAGNHNWDAARFFRKKKEEVEILWERERASNAKMWEQIAERDDRKDQSDHFIDRSTTEKTGGTE